MPLDPLDDTLGHVATNALGGPVTTSAEQVIAFDAPDGEDWAEARVQLEGAVVPWREAPFAAVTLPEKPGPVQKLSRPCETSY